VRRQDLVASGARDLEEGVVTSGDDTGIWDWLLQAAAGAAAPQLTSRGLARRFGPPPEWTLAPGDLWRARWDEVSLLVHVLAIEEESVLVAPATVEPTGEDETSLVIDAHRMTIGQPLTIWAGLARAIPLYVLDRPIDDLGVDIATWCSGPPSDRVPAGTRRGRAPASPSDMDIDVRAMVDDDLKELADAASWAPPPAAQGTVSTARPASLNRDVLVRLQQRLGRPLPDVLALIDGKRPATPDETAALREVTGTAPEPVPPPGGLVIELSHPRWRPAACAYAARAGRSEPEARLAMAYEIAGGSMAARQTGTRGPAWRDRVRAWVAAHGLSGEDT
jgi:hypothetical protein